MSTETFDKRAAKVKTLVSANKGKLPEVDDQSNGSVMTAKQARELILTDMRTAIAELNSLRTGDRDRRGVDITFAQYVQEKWGFSSVDGQAPDSFYLSLGINPAQSTIASLMSMPEMPEGYRWIVPEIVREAIRLGLRRAPIYPSLIAAEETVAQPTVILPNINLSDVNARRINEAETIPTGTVSFGQKQMKLHKVGTGLKITDEVIQFVSINLLSLYLQDAGLHIGAALDALAIDTLVNGEQADGSEASAVIGVANTTNGITYFDLLRAWLRMGRIGRLPGAMLSSETEALKVMMMDEFRGTLLAGQKLVQLNFRVPIPQTQDYFIHGSAPSGDKLLLVDTSSSLIKLNVGSLKVESERIAERQLSGTYVTFITGFSTLFRDARLIIDGSLAFASSHGFPTWMDIDVFEQNVLEL